MAVKMGRLGPVYEAEDLKKTIAALQGTPTILNDFFGIHPTDVPICQGDVLRIGSKIPHIDASGDAAGEDNPSGLWQVLGNTCDLDREISDVPYSQVAPVTLFTPPDNSPIDQKLIQYKTYRTFYMPPAHRIGSQHMLTDLTRPVSVHKQALLECAENLARLNTKPWMLFHCILVRFLARDDGRYT